MANKMMNRPNQGQMPPIQKMNLSREAIQSAKQMTCQNMIPNLKENKPNEQVVCGCDIFVEAFNLKYISPILSPMAKETIAAVQMGKMCVNCGKLFNPDEWLKNYKEQGEVKNAKAEM